MYALHNCISGQVVYDQVTSLYNNHLALHVNPKMRWGGGGRCMYFKMLYSGTKEVVTPPPTPFLLDSLQVLLVWRGYGACLMVVCTLYIDVHVSVAIC